MIERGTPTRYRIAVLTSEFPSISQTFVLDQVVGLLARGCDVQVYALDGPPPVGSPVHPAFSEYRLAERTHYPPAVPAARLKRVRCGTSFYLRHLRRSPRVLTRALNVWRHPYQAGSLRLLFSAIPLLDAPAHDVIHCQFGTIGLTGLALRDIGAIRGKLVVSFRGHDVSRVVKAQGKAVYRELFARADLLLTNCDYFRERLWALGCDPGKLRVHRTGIDCCWFTPPAQRRREEQLRIVSIGRLVEKKGFEDAIGAVRLLADQRIPVRYDIVGEGVLRPRLSRRIIELGLQEVVVLRGAMDRSDIVALLRDSDVLVAPSVTAADGDEDAPVNSLKEAMACGLPVVATRHGGIPELVEDGVSGFLVAERDSAALARSLQLLSNDPGMRDRMGLAGHSFVRTNFDVDALNDRLVQIYASLLSDKQGQRG